MLTQAGPYSFPPLALESSSASQYSPRISAKADLPPKRQDVFQSLYESPALGIHTDGNAQELLYARLHEVPHDDMTLAQCSRQRRRGD